MVPTCYYLTNVECPTLQTCDIGSYADIFKGTYNGETVALKYLRIWMFPVASGARKLERVITYLHCKYQR